MHIDQVKLTDDLVDIARQCNHSDWNAEDDAELLSYTPESLKTYLQDDKNILVTARIDATIVGVAIGYVLVHPGGNKTLYIDELDVRPASRRQGVASAIIKKYQALAVSEFGCGEVWLSTNYDNKNAQSFYRSLSPTEDKNAIIFGWSLPQ